MIVLPGIRDHQLKKEFRGEVFLFGNSDSRKELIAVVYGKNLREMRRRKRAVASALDAVRLEEDKP